MARQESKILKSDTAITIRDERRNVVFELLTITKILARGVI